MKHCPECNAVYNPRWEKCASCGHPLQVDPCQNQVTCSVESAILERAAKMVLDPNTPDQVVFDGVTYTMVEISKLKTLDRESLIAAHNVKSMFGGTVK